MDMHRQKTLRVQDRRAITRLDQVEINSMKPLNNLVLLKKMSDNRVGKLMGKEIRLDTKYTPEFYADVIFKVEKTPRNLVYDNGRDEFGNYYQTDAMEWKCRMDLQEGDIVWINYNQALNSLAIDGDDGQYQLVHYQHIYLSLRPWNPDSDSCVLHINPEKLISIDDDGIARVEKGYMPEVARVEYKKHGTDKKISRKIPIEGVPENVMFRRDEHEDYDEISFWKVIMHNGYVLFTEVPVEKQEVITLKEHQERFGIVQYLGRPNDEYREYSMWDDNRVRIGDMIHLAYKFSKKLENNPLIARFGDGHLMHITQRHRILGVIPKGKW